MIASAGHELQLTKDNWGCTLQRAVHAISAGVSFRMVVIELLKGETPTEDVEAFMNKVRGYPDLVGVGRWSWKGQYAF